MQLLPDGRPATPWRAPTLGACEAWLADGRPGKWSDPAALWERFAVTCHGWAANRLPPLGRPQAYGQALDSGGIPPRGGDEATRALALGWAAENAMIRAAGEAHGSSGAALHGVLWPLHAELYEIWAAHPLQQQQPCP